jgi:PAS domain S-box-containing protein
MRLAVKETETKNLLETLANKSPVGLYIVQDGRFCYTNPTFQSTTGYKEDELLGRDALKLVVSEDREQVRENAIKMLKGELTSPYQFRVTHKNGSIKWVMESVVSVQYHGRRATLGYFVDITERKRMEEALRDSEEKLRKMFESVTDGISVIDLKGIITEVNQRTVEMHGYSSKDELQGKNALELLASRDHKRITANTKKVIKQGAIRGVEYTLLRADGSEFPGELSTNSLKDASGNLLGHITIVRDITERKQAEEKMQHLHLVLLAIRNINKLIARGTDRDSLLRGVCDTFVKTSGYYSAWIAILDESGKLVTAAEAGLGKSFLQIMERLKRGELTHCGCKVLEKPGVMVMKDVSSECEDCPLAKEDTGRGAISVRLEYNGKVYGLMTVSIPPGRAAEKEEHNMLDEIAGDIGFALHSMEQEQERKRAEEALQDSEEKLWKIFESATDGISVIDLKGIITEVNQRMVEMHGYSSKDEQPT